MSQQEENGSINHKSKKVQYKILKLYKSREEVNKLFNGYSKIASKAKYRSIHGEGLKISTSKQMLQKLPIGLADVKADNNSENQLNKIRQIIYSVYQ